MSRWIADNEDARRELHLWVGEIPEALRELRAEELTAEFPFDFGAGSLEALEAHLLEEARRPVRRSGWSPGGPSARRGISVKCC
ncbi:hypothetical protein [Streptomyces lydicus]|uniref:hypothetical protein n=1 Tax=Streptomyces lydicus TaxID=47763 RepID=UPI0037D0F79A